MEDYTDPLILQSLEGAEAARLLTIATFALLVYEWCITLDSEVSRARILIVPLPHINHLLRFSVSGGGVGRSPGCSFWQ